ncbi:MAG: spermidine synthase [Methylomonas sp.]|nr:MAG: spermidine synthase [Methylomonas sp.]
MDITHQTEIRRDNFPILLFALTLFSSASLMFVLQPMFGKALLPLLGGSASVWNTCMVFYQSILFLGYLYAHLLSTRLSYRKNLLIHSSLLLISIYFLPISIPEDSRPPTSENPSFWLLTTLFSSIGLPLFILSTNSPLLQKWFSKIGHQTSSDPYYLSIASNTGSLMALLSYPFLLEPSIGISQQQHYWSNGFLILIAMIALCMMFLKQHHFQPDPVMATKIIQRNTPSLKLKLRWLLLAFVPSSLLLGTTNFISIDIATVPLLWVVPLAIYLLSFILVFSNYGNSIHKKILLLQPWVITPFLIYYFSNHKLASISMELLLHLCIFFISIMVCHGELAKKRPATEYLTEYYLIMSFGGMLGGIFNSFVAPFIFSAIYEYPLMIVGGLFLNPIHKRIKLYVKAHLAKIIFGIYVFSVAAILFINIDQTSNAILVSLAVVSAMGIAYLFFKKSFLYFPLFGLLLISCAAPEKQHGNKLLLQSRNFYGVLSIKAFPDYQVGNTKETIHELYSGTTRHGLQLVDNQNQRCTPNGYYSPQGPLGSLFSQFNSQNQDWRVGVVGLGAGEMAGYAKASQNWTFFELDPAVVQIATNPAYFTYLSECIQNYAIETGDARINLEKQSQQYDLLVIDAFTSDSIPTHLLTREAIELYTSKLSNKGLLVFHISNRYLALKNVLADHAQKLGLGLMVQEYRPQQNIPLVYRSDWAVLAKNQALLTPLARQNWQDLHHSADTVAWTDDFTSIMSVWK